jgi:hypothetical protein
MEKTSAFSGYTSSATGNGRNKNAERNYVYYWEVFSGETNFIYPKWQKMYIGIALKTAHGKR